MDLLLCQRDAYLKEIEAGVLECVPVDGGFDVRLSETLLYPEGGGQPSDAGWVDGNPVLGLRRDRNGEVWHRLADAVEDEVRVQLDWERRYDHMQQHTAQHLLTAECAEAFGWQTVAFHLGDELSDIELDVQELAPELLEEVEDRVNARIRQGLVVRIREVTVEEYGRMMVRSRGLPDGMVGTVRLVQIDGVDVNTCGGTHVATLSELQCVKLMRTERTSRGVRLSYVAGHRAMGWMREALARERELTELLSGGADTHVESVERLLDSVKTAQRSQRVTAEALAGVVAPVLIAKGPPSAWHWPTADMEMLNLVAQAVQRLEPEHLCVLTGGEGDGVFLVVGPEDEVQRRGPELAALLEGRGGGRGGRFQGKANRLDRRPGYEPH
jgi:misacylated tRNA(Ala) deacylase